jgi:hypothetical protein
LLLCSRANIIWNGISFISINEVPPIKCRPEGPSFWYQRQQKLRITVNGKKKEYELTGNVTLEWIRESFEQKSNKSGRSLNWFYSIDAVFEARK